MILETNYMKIRKVLKYDEQLFVLPQSGDSIYIYDCYGNELKKKINLKNTEETFWDIAIFEEQIFVSMLSNKHVVRVDINSKDVELIEVDESSISFINYDNKIYGIGSETGNVYLIDISECRPIFNGKEYKDVSRKGKLKSVELKGKIVSLINGKPYIYIYDIKENKLSIENITINVKDIFSDEVIYLLAEDGSIIMYDIENNKRKIIFDMENGAMMNPYSHIVVCGDVIFLTPLFENQLFICDKNGNNAKKIVVDRYIKYRKPVYEVSLIDEELVILESDSMSGFAIDIKSNESKINERRFKCEINTLRNFIKEL